MCKDSESKGNANQVQGLKSKEEPAQNMSSSGRGKLEQRLERDQIVEGSEGQGQESCLCLTGSGAPGVS